MRALLTCAGLLIQLTYATRDIASSYTLSSEAQAASRHHLHSWKLPQCNPLAASCLCTRHARLKWRVPDVANATNSYILNPSSRHARPMRGAPGTANAPRTACTTEPATAVAAAGPPGVPGSSVAAWAHCTVVRPASRRAVALGCARPCSSADATASPAQKKVCHV